MAKYKVEYRIVNKSDDGSDIQQSKKIVEGADLGRTIQSLSTSDGLEFLTIRIIKPKPEAKKPEAKK